MNKFSIGEAMRFGWTTMKANFWFFVGLIFTVFAVRVFLPGLAGGFRQDHGFRPLALVVGLVSGIVSIIMGIGLAKIALMFVDGQKPRFDEMFAHANLFWRYLGAQILSNLIIGLGFLLLIIPGIIWSLKYSFVGYFVVDKGMGPIEALRHSARVTQGVKWQLLLFWLVMGFVNLAGVLVFGLGLLATIPTTMLATAFVYRKLAASLEPAVPVTTSVQTSG